MDELVKMHTTDFHGFFLSCKGRSCANSERQRVLALVLHSSKPWRTTVIERGIGIANLYAPTFLRAGSSSSLVSAPAPAPAPAAPCACGCCGGCGCLLSALPAAFDGAAALAGATLHPFAQNTQRSDSASHFASATTAAVAAGACANAS